MLSLCSHACGVAALVQSPQSESCEDSFKVHESGEAKSSCKSGSVCKFSSAVLNCQL